MVYTLLAIRKHGTMDALAGLAATPPSYSDEAVHEAIARHFGLFGELRPLVSERDQNFCLLTAAGGRFLVKVTSATETRTTTDFQVRVLQHLEQQSDVIAPRVIATLAGAACGRIGETGSIHRLRLLSWVDGEQLEERGIDSVAAARFGRALGALDDALAGFEFDGENPVLLWDLQRVAELRPVLACIDDVAVRRRAEAAIDDYEAFVLPVKDSLGRQVIHADANPENVLRCADGIGFIDFSDIVQAPRVFDLGIAASYLRTNGDDPLTLLRPFIAAYHSLATLRTVEADVLFDLIRARLATSIVLLYWRLRERPADDEYRRKSLQLESDASQFLAALDQVGRASFARQIKELLTDLATT